MTWWKDNNLRLIQNNLREIDAGMDVDRLIAQVKAFGANTLMVNAGGIFAFYPSKLRYHHVTPYLKSDLLGEMIEKARAAGLRLIARFDFSKAHESIYRQRPEWFYRSEEGKIVNYGGIVHTCLNGGYQQQYAMSILDEALTLYEPDGVFFNMFGYQNWDYSGNYYGLCHCASCRRRFMELHGMELPPSAERGTARQLAYLAFQRETAVDMLDRIHAHIKRLRPEAAISTYHTHKVDIVRHESNTSLRAPHPRWQYTAAVNIMPVAGGYEGKLSSNCSINAIDLTYRFTGVSRYETEQRLYESLLSGSGLDFCIIGVFEDYPDRENYAAVSSVFALHQANEQLYGKGRPVVDVVLVKPAPGPLARHREFLGLFKMLKESHLLFEVIDQSRLERLEESGARLVLLPGIAALTDTELAQLAAVQRRGMQLLATGGALFGQAEALQQLFDATPDAVLEDTLSSYVRVEDKGLVPELAERDWVIVDGPFTAVTFGVETERKLPYIAPSSFGPPERAYGHVESERCGLGMTPPSAEGAGGSGYIGWNVGELYYSQGFADHRHLVAGAIRKLLGGQLSLRTNAHPSVQLSLYQLPDGSQLLQLLNGSGFNGTTYEAPLEQRGLTVELAGLASVGGGVRVRQLQREAAEDGAGTDKAASLEAQSPGLETGKTDLSGEGVPGEEGSAKVMQPEAGGVLSLEIPSLSVYAAYHLTT